MIGIYRLVASSKIIKNSWVRDFLVHRIDQYHIWTFNKDVCCWLILPSFADSWKINWVINSTSSFSVCFQLAIGETARNNHWKRGNIDLYTNKERVTRTQHFPKYIRVPATFMYRSRLFFSALTIGINNKRQTHPKLCAQTTEKMLIPSEDVCNEHCSVDLISTDRNTDLRHFREQSQTHNGFALCHHRWVPDR